jgi:hypothetical protein
MSGPSTLRHRRACLRAIVGGLFFIIMGAACSGDGTGPSVEAAVPADSAAAGDPTSTPADSIAPFPGDSTIPASDTTVPPPSDSATITGIVASSAHSGIVFGTFNMENSLLGSVHTGSLRAGSVASSFLPVLSDARAKGARLVIKLTGGSASHVKNADGTFSFTKWKALIDKARTVDFGPYVADGTIIGHYLIDEPNMAHRWGGKVVPQATIEAMAKYSKQIWPTMHTLVRVVPTWLASAPVTYTYLDAGWAQYTAVKGDAASWIAREASAAKSKGLGLIASLNVLNGGNGSSKIAGPESGKYSMSAAELRSYGSALLNQTYICGFFQWMYNSTYYGRSDIKSAMSDLSAKARTHVKTSCRQ